MSHQALRQDRSHDHQAAPPHQRRHPPPAQQRTSRGGQHPHPPDRTAGLRFPLRRGAHCAGHAQPRWTRSRPPRPLVTHENVTRPREGRRDEKTPVAWRPTLTWPLTTESLWHTIHVIVRPAVSDARARSPALGPTEGFAERLSRGSTREWGSSYHSLSSVSSICANTLAIPCLMAAMG